MSVVCDRFHRRICLKEVSGWRRKRTALRTRSCLPNSPWPSPPRPRVSRSASHFTHTTLTPSHIKPVSLSPLSYSTQPLKVRDSPRSVLAHLCVCVSTETLILRHWAKHGWQNTEMWMRWVSSQCRAQHQDQFWVWLWQTCVCVCVCVCACVCACACVYWRRGWISSHENVSTIHPKT